MGGKNNERRAEEDLKGWGRHGGVGDEWRSGRRGDGWAIENGNGGDRENMKMWKKENARK